MMDAIRGGGFGQAFMEAVSGFLSFPSSGPFPFARSSSWWRKSAGRRKPIRNGSGPLGP